MNATQTKTQTKTLDVNHPNYYDSFLETISKNTSNNLHTENAVLIAYNFGNETDKKFAKHLQEEHDRTQYLNYFPMMARHYFISSILFSMKDKNLAIKISKCLWYKY